LTFIKNNKGQVAFEFILILSIVLFLSTALMMDFFNEANLSMMAGQTKNLFESEIGRLSITDKKCIGTYLKNFSVDGDVFNAEVRGPCKPKDGEIARQIEMKLCASQGNGNNIIECPPYEYVVKMGWKIKG